MTEKSTSVRRNELQLPGRNLEFWWVAEKATELWCWPIQNLCKINTQDRALVWVKGRGSEIRREDKKQGKEKKKPKSESHAEVCDWFSSMRCQKVTWKGAAPQGGCEDWVRRHASPGSGLLQMFTPRYSSCFFIFPGNYVCSRLATSWRPIRRQLNFTDHGLDRGSGQWVVGLIAWVLISVAISLMM